MKKYFLLILLVLGILSSCTDYLEFPPEGSQESSNFWADEADAQLAVNAMYGYLRTWDITAFNYLILGSVPSDEIIKGSVVGDGSWANAYDNYEFTKTQGQINDFWASRYKAINLSNQVLANVPGIDMDENVKARMIAEAKFLRGMHYFYLARAFGGVPIVDSIMPGIEGIVRTTLDETYDFIEKNFEEAIPDLPEVIGSAEYGRASQWAAKAFLAKVYLYREKWQECYDMTYDIMENGGFILYPSFYDLFRPEQEFCSESVFEIISSEIEGNTDISTSQFAETQLPRGISNWGGWGWFAPSDACAQAFDDAGDVVRKKVTILYYGDVTEDGDTIAGVTTMEGVETPRYNGKVYVPSIYNHTTGPAGCEQNIRIMRYAEVLLMNAEAAIHTGDDAATPLNDVRDRAGLDPISSPTIEDVWNERQLELAGEQDRYWDVIRTGRAATIFGPLGFVTGKHELYPIPQTQIDLAGDLLEQNPNW